MLKFGPEFFLERVQKLERYYCSMKVQYYRLYDPNDGAYSVYE